MNTVPVHVRWMVRRDMPEALAIERAGFGAPWSEDDFLRVLRQRNCIGMVAERGGRVDGFMVYELSRGEITLLNLATHPYLRRTGVGRALVAKLASKLHPRRRTAVVALARETNGPAHLFFRACGFRATGVVRDYFPDTGEDAYRFAYLLDEHPRHKTAVPTGVWDDDDCEETV